MCNRGLVYTNNRKCAFGKERGIDQCLHDVISWLEESDIDEDRDVISIAIRRDDETGGLGNGHGVHPVGRQHAHFAQILPFAAPVVDDGKLDHRHWQARNNHLMSHAHQAQMIARLEAHVLAKEGIDEPEIVG